MLLSDEWQSQLLDPSKNLVNLNSKNLKIRTDPVLRELVTV